MNRIEVNTYKLKIINCANDGQLTDILKEIIACGEFPADLLQPLNEALQAKKYIWPETLVDVIFITGSEDLYRIARSEGFFDRFSYALLFRKGFGSEPVRTEIERILCQQLYNCWKKDGDLLRSYIVEGMAENGGSDSLQYLEVIAFQLESSIPERIYDLRTKDSLDMKSRTNLAIDIYSSETFLVKVKDAIKKISRRLAD